MGQILISKHTLSSVAENNYVLLIWFGIEAFFLTLTRKLLVLIVTLSARLKCPTAKHINIRGS